MFYYYNLSIKPFLINKFFWIHLKSLPSFCNVEIFTFNKRIKPNLDSDVFKSIAFLEVLGQQSSGNFFFSFIDKRRRISCHKAIITLRHKFLYEFLSYFFCFLLNFIKRTNDLRAVSLGIKNAYKFLITDFSVFPFLPLTYYYWKKMFLVEFFFSNNFLLQIKLLLSCFNFPLN